MKKFFLLAAALHAAPLLAQNATVAPAPGVLAKGAETLYGPFVSTAVELPGEKPEFVARGILVHPDPKHTVLFNVDTLRYEGAWKGDFIDFARTNLGTYKGLSDGAALLKGEPIQSITTRTSMPFTERPRFLGTYVAGSDVIFSYELEGTQFLDNCRFETKDGVDTLVRNFGIGPGAQSFSLPLPAIGRAEYPGARTDWGWISYFDTKKEGKTTEFDIKRTGPDLHKLIEDTAPNWPETITTKGTRAEDNAAYVVDTIPLPEENPWKCWIRPTGIDFFPDGRAAICTLGGDVWIVSGLDDKLEKVTWRRFAGGLREPMGLRIVDGKIFVGCRDQITRLHDQNNDGEADFYECVNMGRELVPNFHAFAYDLQTDRAGSFYYATGGNQLAENQAWHAKLFRVSPDGKKLDAVASGFRAPNGVTVGPDDSVYVAENQGQWIPSSKISRVRPGGFYGFVADPKASPKAVAPPSFDPPVCYLPMSWDNSSGGGAFCEGDTFGPFKGRMMHTSFGAAALFAIFEQRVGEVSQGAAVKFPLPAFESGIHRARFSPTDGQLYVCGIKGWQSRAVKDGCLARIRYTGKPVLIPTGFQVAKAAVTIDFAVPLDPATAGDAENYGAERWNYQWHATYGSPDVSIKDPKKRGRDRVEIRSAKLSADKRSVTLEVPDLGPAMQMLWKLNIKTADGAAIETEVANTINVIP